MLTFSMKTTTFKGCYAFGEKKTAFPSLEQMCDLKHNIIALCQTERIWV